MPSRLSPLERVGLWGTVVTVFSGIFVGMAAIISETIPAWVVNSASAIMLLAAIFGLAALAAMGAAVVDTFRETALAHRVGWGSNRHKETADQFIEELAIEVEKSCQDAPSTDPKTPQTMSAHAWERINGALRRAETRSEGMEDPAQGRRVREWVMEYRRVTDKSPKNPYSALLSVVSRSREGGALPRPQAAPPPTTAG